MMNKNHMILRRYLLDSKSSGRHAKVYSLQTIEQ